MNKFVSQTEKALKKKKKRWTTKGRQVEEKYLEEIKAIFKNRLIKRDELIENLHLIQDNFGILYSLPNYSIELSLDKKQSYIISSNAGSKPQNSKQVADWIKKQKVSFDKIQVEILT